MKPKPNARYKTTGGFTANIFDRGKNLLEEECWRGTIVTVGFGTWDDEGRDLTGDTRFDLAQEIPA